MMAIVVKLCTAMTNRQLVMAKPINRQRPFETHLLCSAPHSTATFSTFFHFHFTAAFPANSATSKTIAFLFIRNAQQLFFFSLCVCVCLCSVPYQFPVCACVGFTPEFALYITLHLPLLNVKSPLPMTERDGKTTAEAQHILKFILFLFSVA